MAEVMGGRSNRNLGQASPLRHDIYQARVASMLHGPSKKKPAQGRLSFEGGSIAQLSVGTQAKLASAKPQLTKLFRKVSTNLGRRLR